MTRIKKSRKPKAIATKAKEPKAIKDKKPKKHVGKKSGTRQQEGVTNKTTPVATAQTKDARHGSKKPIALTQSVITANTSAKPKAKQAPLAKVRVADDSSALRQELAAIEQDEQLLAIVDKQDLDQTLTTQEHEYYQQKMARYQQIQQQLGIDDDAEIAETNAKQKAGSDDDLWDKFDSDDLSRFDQFED